MILTVDEFRVLTDTDESDARLEARLAALEELIRGYTNNNFQARAFRAEAEAHGHTLTVSVQGLFRAGDTLQITGSKLNAGLVYVTAKEGNDLTVREALYDESGVTVTKVVYPEAVRQGAAALLNWQLERAGKEGVQSESLSRHSVTYLGMDGDNAVMGFPRPMLGFLRPYMRAQFGQGVDV